MSFSSGSLSPLFSTSDANASTSPAQSFTASNAAQNGVLAGPATGGAGAYSFRTLVAADTPESLAKAQNLADVASPLTANRNLGVPYNERVPKSVNYTAAATDKGKVLDFTTGTSALTATLPAASTAGDGYIVFIRKADTGTGLLTISIPSLMGGGSATVALLTQNHVMQFRSDGSTWYPQSFYGIHNSAGGITITGALTLNTSLQVGSAGAVVTLTRNILATRDNATVTGAITNTGNTWNQYNDLTSFNDSTRLANGAPPAQSGQDASILVGSADVATGDYFVATVGTTTWLFIYDRRVYNGTSGWRRQYLAGDLELFGTGSGVIMTVSGTRVRARITGTAGSRTWSFDEL